MIEPFSPAFFVFLAVMAIFVWRVSLTQDE